MPPCMAKKDKASIYIDLQALFKIIYQAQFQVPKRDRIALINRMLDHCERCIGYFTMAYEYDDKSHCIEMLVAEYEALKIECRLAIDDLPIIKSEATKKDIREKIASIETGIEKWRSYLYSLRHEQHLDDVASP